MGNYRETKKKLEQEKQKLENANKQTKKLDNKSKEIIDLLDNLKPVSLRKNNNQISNENIGIIKNYIESVTDVTKTVRNVNDLNMAIKNFEHSAFEIEKENRSLKYQLGQKDIEINNLKSDVSIRDKIIHKLKEEKEGLKTQLRKFKGFWYSIMTRFHNKITYDNDKNYIIVSDDLYKNGVFDDNEKEIATNIYRKVAIPTENKNFKKKRVYNLE